MVLSPIGDMAEDIMDIPELEIDPNFEPQIRARSNTWPAVRREDVLPNKNDQVSVTVTDENGECKEEGVSLPLSPTAVLAGQQKSKGSARRNAWGNSSYADLITKAIQGSPEQRLTLSQIYDWMVQNVPYFKDKGDSNSSAGWKNSIRHNLSLHNRFMRIQNEGTGKSSWWILNPDAKPGKSPRRRATSMDTKTYEKKRGRVKKKVEAMRAALEGNPSPTSTTLSESTGDLLESSTYGFQLSPDFRPRTSSNASSCGRLSPIHSTMEPDLHDNQVPSMSPIPWQTEGLSKSYSPLQDQYADHLTDSLADIVKLADSTVIDDCSGNNSLMETGVRTNSCSPTPIPQPHIIQSRNNMDQFESDSYNFVLPDYEDSFPLPPPPPYPNQINCSPPRQMINMAGGSCTMTPNMRTQSIANVNLAMAASNPGLGCNDISDEMDIVSSSQDVVGVQQGRDCTNQVPMSVNGLSRLLLRARDARLQQLQALHTQLQSVHQCQNMTLLTGLPDSSILRSALTLQKAANSPNMDGNNQYAMATSNTNFMSPEQLSTQQALHPNVLDSISPFGIPQDLDFSLDTLQGIECDIEQVIKHELNVDGSLNCEFDTIDGQTSNGLVH